MIHWLWVHAGLGDGAGAWYLFWSGVFGCGLVGSGIWHNNYLRLRNQMCHEPRCFRHGHLMADGHTRSCWRHHPEGKPRPGHVRRRHEQHLARQAAKGREAIDP